MTEYFYPERMARIILLAMEEVIGREGVHSVLNLSSLASYTDQYPAARSEKTFPFKAVTQLQESLEQVYGPQGGRGTALRVGRACFQYGLREYGSMLGITEMTFRLLPLSSKSAEAQSRLLIYLLIRQVNVFRLRRRMENCSGTLSVVRCAGNAAQLNRFAIWRWDFCRRRFIG